MSELRLAIGCNTLLPDRPLTAEHRFTGEEVCEALRRIAQVGFEACEFSHIDQLTEQEVRAVRECLEGLPVEAWSAHAWMPTPERNAEGFRRGTQELVRQARVAARLGCRVLVYHPCFTNYAGDAKDETEGLEPNAEILVPACGAAADVGITIAIENGSTLVHMNHLLRLVELVQAPNLGLCVDTGHAHLGELGPARAIRMSGEKLVTLHLQDNEGKYDQHMPPGMGRIDWEEVARALAEVAYEGVLELELTDAAGTLARDDARPGGYDQEAEMAQGLRTAQQMREWIRGFEHTPRRA